MLSSLPINRALISVSDKVGVVDFARALHEHGAELISTGGTAKVLEDAGLPVTSVDEVTGFPEMLDGRVKTLHPLIHGGLLGRRDMQSHLDAMKQYDIKPIDLICIDLYPFEQTISTTNVSEPEAIEQIDIGGPAMIRSGAKTMNSLPLSQIHRNMNLSMKIYKLMMGILRINFDGIWPPLLLLVLLNMTP